MTTEILQGDALTVLRTLPADHFHCVVTSPPYFGLRDYGTGAWEGGDPACGHVGPPMRTNNKPSNGSATFHGGTTRANEFYRDVCGKCGARRVDQQIGLEANVEEWVARLVEVFREVRRCLRSYGCALVNLGDSYQDKQLVGQPWRLAFALQADGWFLRGDYIWAKKNCMPESTRDRCTKSHEYIFHLAKSPRYFWDSEAVRESAEYGRRSTFRAPTYEGGNAHDNDSRLHSITNGGSDPSAGRNMRSVWTIATDPLPSVEVDGEKLDHFASYPGELARRCILAGTSAKGCCPACGAPWARVVETSYENPRNRTTNGPRSLTREGGSREGFAIRLERTSLTTDWCPTCSCLPAAPIPCTVLDPFGGSGRTALACEELGRDCTLIELNPKSVAMAKAQLERAKARRMIGDVTDRTANSENQLRLFA